MVPELLVGINRLQLTMRLLTSCVARLPFLV